MTKLESSAPLSASTTTFCLENKQSFVSMLKLMVNVSSSIKAPFEKSFNKAEAAHFMAEYSNVTQRKKAHKIEVDAVKKSQLEDILPLLAPKPQRHLKASTFYSNSANRSVEDLSALLSKV